MLARCLLFVALLLLPGFARADEPELPSRERFLLFVLAGQSNMAGRGKVAEVDRKPHPRVLVLDAEGRWRPAVDPLHFDKPRVVGVGLGKTFAETLAEADPEVTIGLIPCAVGGSPIDTWKPKGYHAQTKSHPWDDCVKRVKRAMPDGTLTAVLWHQGESDAKPDLAEAYEAKLHDLIARFRKEFDAPQLPFVAGQMGRFEERPWTTDRETVDAAHRNLPKSIERTAFVSSKGLSHKGDEVHFDAESYRELGRRFAKALRAIPEAD